MKVDIQISKEDGTVVAFLNGDALQPANWKSRPEHPAEEGEFKFFGFTYQPMVVRASKAGGF